MLFPRGAHSFPPGALVCSFPENIFPVKARFPQNIFFSYPGLCESFEMASVPGELRSAGTLDESPRQVERKTLMHQARAPLAYRRSGSRSSRIVRECRRLTRARTSRAAELGNGRAPSPPPSARTSPISTGGMPSSTRGRARGRRPRTRLLKPGGRDCHVSRSWCRVFHESWCRNSVRVRRVERSNTQTGSRPLAATAAARRATSHPLIGG